MDYELHYYVNFLIALHAGFSKQSAYRIAYSAQYVDDNVYQYSISCPAQPCVQHSQYSEQVPQQAPYNVNNCDSVYSNTITQCSIIAQIFHSALDMQRMMCLLQTFHFLPGSYEEQITQKSRRTDKQINIANTIAGSKNAYIILRTALKTHNPYLIGIASHTFLDTWAHQNFTGTFNHFNCINTAFHTPYNTDIDSLIPKIGHIDSLNLPDMVSKVWYDYRLRSCVIDNNVRFLEAIKALYTEYRKFLYYKKMIRNKKSHRNGSGIVGKINSKHFFSQLYQIWNLTCQKKRIKAYRTFCVNTYGCNIPTYRKNRWFNLSVKYETADMQPQYTWKAHKPFRTHWYKFQEAAKKHNNTVHRVVLSHLLNEEKTE